MRRSYGRVHRQQHSRGEEREGLLVAGAAAVLDEAPELGVAFARQGKGGRTRRRASQRSVGAEYLVEAPGESPWVATEPAVLAGERDRFLSQPLDKRHTGAIRE